MRRSPSTCLPSCRKRVERVPRSSYQRLPDAPVQRIRTAGAGRHPRRDRNGAAGAAGRDGGRGRRDRPRGALPGRASVTDSRLYAGRAGAARCANRARGRENGN
ncbi:hypothetical protein G6F68_020431 [Rhizopus microsporus]|nr:hypothetical protein G6F68_020431 [Rhizopus microsporus]